MYNQFAVMSSIFATEVMGISAPTIGLLNVGEEPEKGMDLHKEVYRMLQEEFETFTGNIEGGDILLGKTDIYLCDGFAGNVLLKFGESIPEILRNLLPKTMKKERLDEESQKLVYRVITETMKPFNYEHDGGIHFVRVNAMRMLGHVSSSTIAISHMIHTTINYIQNKINHKIVASLNP